MRGPPPPARAFAGNPERHVPGPVAQERHPLDLQCRDDQLPDLPVRNRAAGVIHDLDDHEVRVEWRPRCSGTRGTPDPASVRP